MQCRSVPSSTGPARADAQGGVRPWEGFGQEVDVVSEEAGEGVAGFGLTWRR